MKPKSIRFDRVFEKHWQKYLMGLTGKQKEHLRARLSIFKVMTFVIKRALSATVRSIYLEITEFSIYSVRT
jgi:hypothetical protein